MKSLITGAAAIAAVGAAAVGATAFAPGTPVAPEVHLTVFDVPVPLAPADDVPTADQVVSLLNGVADPNVSASNKSGLVEGGLSRIEQSVMDGRMQKGLDNGKLPLTISAANIEPAGAGTATAEVTASSPKLAQRSVNLKFVDQDGWKLSHDSLMMLSQLSTN